MSTERLHLALRALAAVTCLGVAAELGLASHWESPPQLVPFVLSLIGVIGAGLAGRAALVGGVLVGLGGLFGIWEHLEHNYSFAAEIDASATATELAVEAVTGGNPLLAPGAFLVAAALLGLIGSTSPR